MSTLSPLALTIFALTPLMLTVGLLVLIIWTRARANRATSDGPRWLLGAFVQHMPPERRDWGQAMLAEIDQLQDRSVRWQFAFGCAKVALFPPATTSLPRYWFNTIRRLEPKCGALSVVLPPIGVPLLVLAAFTAQTFTTHDNFFNGEFVPGLVGAFILVSFACIVAGVPLGIAGILRRESIRWPSLIGPFLSLAIICYTMLVQHFANRNL